jgi:hypothetical protein
MANAIHPLIIIGAARSGTKILRDIIATHPDVDRVPYDITYIWRLGNESHPDDELRPEMLTPRIGERIKRQIFKYHQEAPFLVEKTVGNCLRVDYVDAVFPQARFIHLVRDGRDVVESVYRQWLSPPDWRYIMEKARSYPLFDAWRYAGKYLLNIVRRSSASSRKTSIWGPRYRGIEQDASQKTVEEVCAIQWVNSVRKATEAFRRFPADRLLSVRYEDFVNRPELELARVAAFAGLDPGPYRDPLCSGRVSKDNIGKGFRSFDSEQRRLVMEIIGDTLVALDYP